MGVQCCDTNAKFDGMSARYRQILIAVIAINITMFAVEMIAGVAAGSMALKADALDFLADSVTYAISLAVIGMSLRVRSMAALFKGLSLGLLAAWILGTSLWRVFVTGVPDGQVMGWVGALALAANLASVLLLLAWKDGDANVRSVWLCSRNDAIGNVAVIGAGIAVTTTGMAWPDLAVALALSGLFLTGAVKITRQALAELSGADQEGAAADPAGKRKRLS